MAEQKLKTRLQNKRGTSTEWAAATNFVPLAGEICFYSDLNKIKIGDGTKKIGQLDFVEPRQEYITIRGTSGNLSQADFYKVEDGEVIIENSNISSTYDDNLYFMFSEYMPSPPDADVAYIYSCIGTSTTNSNKKSLFQITFKDTRNYPWELKEIEITSGYYIEVTSTSGTITQTQYDLLWADPQSYIVYKMASDRFRVFYKTQSANVNMSFVYMDDGANMAALEISDSLTYEVTTFRLVTTNTEQTIGGHKTFSSGLTADAISTFNATVQFNENVTLACPIVINNNAGTSGQVLTSQGAGNPPTWKTPSGSGSTPTNMVTTDTEQTITGKKTFNSYPWFNSGASFGDKTDFSTTAWFVSGVDLEGASSSISTTLLANNDYQQTLWMPVCQTSASTPENALDNTLMTPAAYSSVKNYTTSRISGGIKLYGNADYNIMLAEYDDNYYPAFNINVGQDTADTKVFAVTATQGGEGRISFNAPLYMGTNAGSAGYALCSAGSTSVPYWKRIAQNSSISKTAYQSTGTNVAYSSATYSGSSSTVTFYYTELNNGQDTYRRIYTGRYTASVTAGKWVRIAAPYTSATPASVTVTPYKTTTAGYGPRLIAVGVASYIYVGIDDDDAPAGFYVTVIY